jgi:hypothetical protein
LWWCVEICVVQLQHIDVHVHIACCIHCATWESSVMTDCVFLLNSSSSTHFHRKSKILTFGPDQWMWLPWWWRQKELQKCFYSNFRPFSIKLMKTIGFAVTTIFAPRLSKIMLFNCMIFCIDLLLFYTTNIMNFTS